MPIGLLPSVSAFGEYAEIHGINMYYEVHGDGRPVVLLHGGTGTIQSSFAEQIPVLAQHHRVIALEQMGHGHTGDVGGRELSYEGMTKDTAALLAKLRINNADVIRWSDGGQLALRLAFHNTLVRRVVASGIGMRATPAGTAGHAGAFPRALARGRAR
jgi:pimeloyl-ACP methyl ester carboxylesterase